MNDAVQVTVTHLQKDATPAQNQPRILAGEAPLTIEIYENASRAQEHRSAHTYTIMRTPGDEKQLVAGFLLSEGLVESRTDIQNIEIDASCPNRVCVKIADPVVKNVRNQPVNSSCGLCGRENLDEFIKSLPTIDAGITISPEVLYAFPERFKQEQTLFQATGGSHAAALFDAAGEIHVLREDLARHNAVDKVLGQALLRSIPTEDKALFVSGRVSLEIVIKALRSNISVVAAISAASSLAIATADRLGITLCGYVRGKEITAYTHPDRLR